MAIYLLIYFVEIASSFTSGYMYGSIASESRTRTIEILLTSVSTVQFIAGKFAGLLAVGITQLTIWGAPLIVAVLVLTSIRGVSYLAWFFPLEYTGLVISTLLASYISILADSDRCQ
ncbi:MAG: ABC transporter permease [Anaerolineales bacterium]